jgi:hypothetical protein
MLPPLCPPRLHSALPAHCRIRSASGARLDSQDQRPEFHKALAKALPHLETEIVKRSDQAKGFIVLPKRWIMTVCTMLPSWV